MPNGINFELDFERRIGEMPDRKLLEFVARQTYEVSGLVKTNSGRITELENGNKRASRIGGSISGAVAGAVIGVINYFVNHKG